MRDSNVIAQKRIEKGECIYLQYDTRFLVEGMYKEKFHIEFGRISSSKSKIECEKGELVNVLLFK